MKTRDRSWFRWLAGSGVVVVGLVLGFSVQDVQAGGSTRVAICHFPPGHPDNFHTLTVNQNAVQAHVNNHGDFQGSCNQYLEEVCEENPPNACTTNVDYEAQACAPATNVDCDLVEGTTSGCLPLNGCYYYEAACVDGLNNDHDVVNGVELIDCDDPDCAAAANCYESACEGEIDEDGDGQIDCDDSDCDDAEVCQVVTCPCWRSESQLEFVASLVRAPGACFRHIDDLNGSTVDFLQVPDTELFARVSSVGRPISGGFCTLAGNVDSNQDPILTDDDVSLMLDRYNVCVETLSSFFTQVPDCEE